MSTRFDPSQSQLNAAEAARLREALDSLNIPPRPAPQPDRLEAQPAASFDWDNCLKIVWDGLLCVGKCLIALIAIAIGWCLGREGFSHSNREASRPNRLARFESEIRDWKGTLFFSDITFPCKISAVVKVYPVEPSLPPISSTFGKKYERSDFETYSRDLDAFLGKIERALPTDYCLQNQVEMHFFAAHETDHDRYNCVAADYQKKLKGKPDATEIIRDADMAALEAHCAKTLALEGFRPLDLMIKTNKL